MKRFFIILFLMACTTRNIFSQKLSWGFSKKDDRIIWRAIYEGDQSASDSVKTELLELLGKSPYVRLSQPQPKDSVVGRVENLPASFVHMEYYRHWTIKFEFSIFFNGSGLQIKGKNFIFETNYSDTGGHESVSAEKWVPKLENQTQANIWSEGAGIPIVDLFKLPLSP